MKTLFFSFCFCCLAFFGSTALRAQQNPDRQFGVGMTMGQLGGAVNVGYAFSPNIQAGVAFGRETGGRSVSAYSRFLLPIGTTGISPFVKVAYNVIVPQSFDPAIVSAAASGNNVSLAAGLSYCINQRVNVLSQVHLVNFGWRSLSSFIPFTESYGFPIAIGVEFYF